MVNKKNLRCQIGTLKIQNKNKFFKLITSPQTTQSVYRNTNGGNAKFY
jgi:hypothetical protein